ncbi:MAG: hypothetical protein U9M94_01555, partial [Patescibacteria group bacterium]|nr:hypothetical protein [Patescibacteria group bacterium]
RQKFILNNRFKYFNKNLSHFFNFIVLTNPTTIAGGTISHGSVFANHFNKDVNDQRYKITVLRPNSCKLNKKEKLFYPFSILHELGHANLHTERDRKNRLLVMEKEAWNYAKEKTEEYKLPYKQKEIDDFIKKNLKIHDKKNAIKRRTKRI